MHLALFLQLLFGATDASNILLGWSRFPRGSANVDWPLPRTKGATWQDSNTGDAWLFGGRAVEPREEVFGDLWLFRSRQRSWQQFTPLPGRGRQGAALCGLTNKVIVVVGGLGEDGALSDETAVFDLQNDTWRFVDCNPNPSTDHLTGNNNDTWPSNSTDAPINGTCPMSRYDAIAWCTEGSLWVVGGNDQGDHVLDDVWRMDLTSGSWQRHKDGPLHSESDNLLLLHWAGSEQSPPTVWMTKKYNISEYQLWIFQDDRWSQIDDSSRQEGPWPSARKNAATWTDSFGNLWLYGGVHLIDNTIMADDVWMYKMSANVWVETELEKGAETPGPRQGSIAWADRRHAFLYGGYSECSSGEKENLQNKECIQNDLWLLDVSYNERSSPISSQNENDFLSVADGSNAATTRLGSMSIEQARSPWHEEHSDVFGSVIFFGLSLSFFALFGIVLFFRRCVSCPPREHALLKEPPPVRYTVIPDDTYLA